MGVILKEENVNSTVEVKRVSERITSLKLEIERVMLNDVSMRAPQVGCLMKQEFWRNRMN